MRTCQNNGTEGGFTLFELAVILAIIAVLASMAIPAFSVWMPNYKLRSAARDLYSNLQMARLGAVKQNKQWAVYFDQTSKPGRYFICSDDGGDGWDKPTALGGNDTVEKTVNMEDYDSIDFGHGTLNTDILGDSFTNGNDIYYGGQKFVRFKPRGTSEQGYVYLQNNKKTVYGVGTRLSGVIHLKKWSGTAWE